MAKAYKCDKCKELVEVARSDDIFRRSRIRVEVSYCHTVNAKPLDLCFDCRLELLREVIKGIEAKQTYSWADLKDPKKLAEIQEGSHEHHKD